MYEQSRIKKKNLTLSKMEQKWHVRYNFLSPLSFRHQSIVKGVNALPPEDRLLKFLVDNSVDCEEAVQCANCDWECKKQVLYHLIGLKSGTKLRIYIATMALH